MQDKENKETERKKKGKVQKERIKKNRDKLPISFAANRSMNTKLFIFNPFF